MQTEVSNNNCLFFFYANTGMSKSHWESDKLVWFPGGYEITHEHTAHTALLEKDCKKK